MRHKYKGYVIEPRYKEDSDRVDYFVAKPYITDQLVSLRKQKIEREWHGIQCECEVCTYTEQDRKHNNEIEEKCKALISESNRRTFEKKTLRECKKCIDLAEEAENYFLGALKIGRRRR